MGVYISATILSVIIGYMSVNIKKKDKLMICVMAILASLPLFCVMAFRYNVGTDYLEVYTENFIGRSNGYSIRDFERGFILLIDMIQFFTKNPYWLFIVCAVVFFFFTYKAIYQQSENVPYSILILVIGGHFFAGLNLMRNFMALAIFLYAIQFIRKRKIVPFTIWMLIACSIHQSIIILYPLYFLYQIKFSRRTIIMILIMTIICLPILDAIFETVITKMDYGWYYKYKEKNITLLTSTIIVNLMVLMFQLYYYTKNKDDLVYNMYLKMQLFTAIIAVCSGILPMARRIILLPSFIQVLSIPYITKTEESKKKRWIINITICIVFCIFTIRQITVQEMHSVLPYQTIFGF